MTKIIERVPADNNTLNAEVVVTLRYLSNFWRFFNLLFINCVNGTWFFTVKKCITSEIPIKHAMFGNPHANPPVQAVAAIQKIGATFQIDNTKLHLSVVTLSINYNIKFFPRWSKDLKEQI